jgi:hypothetical protein
MKLTFRGHSYEVSAPIQLDSDSTGQPQIKLTYRGHAYNSTPRFAVTSKVVEVDAPAVTLLYRGNIYKRQLQSSRLYQKPHAINWRYQES